MRAKGFIRILLAVSNSPLKHQELIAKVSEVSTNLVTSFNTPTIATEREYKSNNDKNGDGGSDDEEDLKAITAVFGFFYIAHSFYKQTAAEQRMKRSRVPQIKLKHLNLKYYNNKK